jgi:predicted nuclease of predicted toxin-antitoxin system
MRHEGSGRHEPVASSGDVAFRCRLRGRALEFGRSATASDLAIMAHAKLHDFVVLTHDLDFGAILAATNADKPSVVQIRAGDLAPEALVGPSTIGLRQCERALTDGCAADDRRSAAAVKASAAQQDVGRPSTCRLGAPA